ncbi:MAG: hypothetical protein ACSLFD_02305 [Solirubrobacterales bacterium]
MEGRPRWPAANKGTGMYESYYLRAAHPDEPVAIWIRYTVQKAKGKAPKASLWFTLFDASLEKPLTEKLTADSDQLSELRNSWIKISDSVFGLDLIEGSSGEASWCLRLREAARPLEHLSPPWLYRAPLPKTKPESPVPFARISGEVTIGDRTYVLDRWPGMLGHNWGAEHAWTWVWLSGAGFDEDPDAWIDVVMGRVKVAGKITPWVANGAISLDGKRHRLGGMMRRGVHADPEPGHARFVLPGEAGVKATIETTARKEITAAWNYSGPDGHLHDVLNCSMAALEVGFTDGSGTTSSLTTDHGGTYELGLPDRQDWLEVEPYPDLW